MSGTSNVGKGSPYEADDQRPNESQQDQAKRFHQGKETSHKDTDASMQPGLQAYALQCITTWLRPLK